MWLTSLRASTRVSLSATSFAGSFMDTNGRLCTEAGYAWDGADFCPDVKAVMRASLAHDAVYQLFRKRELPGTWRAEADRLFLRLCIEDGMSAALAWPAFWLLRGFGWTSARPDH